MNMNKKKIFFVILLSSAILFSGAIFAADCDGREDAMILGMPDVEQLHVKHAEETVVYEKARELEEKFFLAIRNN